MKRLLWIAAVFCASVGPALAGAGTITTKDAGGSTQTFVVVTDGSGHFLASTVLCDGTAGARCAQIDANNNLGIVLPAETTKVIGTVRNLGNAGAIFDFAGQNASSPANSILTGCQFNTTPTTITSGNASPCQLDNAGNLLVNVKTAVTANTQTAAGAIAAGAGVDGWDLTQGAKADATWAGSGSGSVIALLKYIGTNVAGPLPAGTNVVGSVSLNQTTFGTTNGVVNAANTYQAVAASQTATVLQTSTGATGDYLSHCTIYPTSTSPGAVTVFDNTNTAANSAILFAGGATSTSNLVPFAIPVGAKSVNGAWKVTTGANVSVVCVGKFS